MKRSIKVNDSIRVLTKCIYKCICDAFFGFVYINLYEMWSKSLHVYAMYEIFTLLKMYRLHIKKCVDFKSLQKFEERKKEKNEKKWADVNFHQLLSEANSKEKTESKLLWAHSSTHTHHHTHNVP